MNQVCVIIVNYNSGSYLSECLDALKEQSFKAFEVIIIDNHSSDSSLPESEEYPELELTIIRNNKNKGFAEANNQAALITKAPLLAFLNPDAFPESDWLECLYNHSVQYPEFSMFGSTQICADNHDKLDGTGDFYHILGIPLRGNYLNTRENLPETGEVFAPCAAAALIRTSSFNSAKGFDTNFFCYCEDIDLAFRLRLLGERCLQVKDAIVYHKGSAITGLASDFSIYHGTRNRLWLFIKNMPLILLIPLLPLHFTLQLLFTAKALIRRKPRAFLKGIKDAIFQIKPILESRKHIQRSRTISIMKLLKTFSYSPSLLLSRKVSLQPIKEIKTKQVII